MFPARGRSINMLPVAWLEVSPVSIWQCLSGHETSPKAIVTRSAVNRTNIDLVEEATATTYDEDVEWANRTGPQEDNQPTLEEQLNETGQEVPVVSEESSNESEKGRNEERSCAFASFIPGLRFILNT